MPRRTPLDKAATASAMAEMGYQHPQISDAVGIARQTVDDIVAGRHGWDRILRDNVAFQNFRAEQKRILHAGSLEVAKKALKRVDETLDKASPAQAALIYGIMRDKERLDAGEPTSIELHVNAEYSEKLAAAQAKLAQILEQKRKEIDVTSRETEA